MPHEELVFEKHELPIQSCTPFCSQTSNLKLIRISLKTITCILKWPFPLSHCALLGENFLYFYFLSLGPWAAPPGRVPCPFKSQNSTDSWYILADLRPLSPKKNALGPPLNIHERVGSHFCDLKNAINKFVVWHKNTSGWRATCHVPI